jgi:hypothetical protein
MVVSVMRVRSSGDPDYTLRHAQRDTATLALRQIAANLRATALNALAWRP